MSDISERRRALIERFRASASVRLGKVTLALVEMQSGAGTHPPSERSQAILRELHTIKGEAKMLDFAPLSETVHAVEERLLATLASSPGAEATEGSEAGVTAVLDAVAVATRWLRGELGEGPVAAEALTHARESLRAPPGITQRPTAGRDVDGAPARRPDGVEADPKERSGPVALGARWVSVNAQQVDGLCELISEFETGFRSLDFKLRGGTWSGGGQAAARERRDLAFDFERCLAQLDDITAWAWGLRLAPLEPLLAELVAHARTLATAQDKRLRVRVDGGRVQIERSILDALSEPLLHLVRNAVDHGIEAPNERGEKGDATLVIHAEASGPNVLLTIEDDGRGIDLDKVRAAAVARGLTNPEGAAALLPRDVLALLFVHGFSTRSEVTDVSGRGVGLDVVRARVEAVGGAVSLTSDFGRGTRFELTVPTTISKERNVVIEAADGLYAIPSRHVSGLLRLRDETIEHAPSGDAVMLNGDRIALHSLLETLGLPSEEDEPVAMVLEVGPPALAFAVPKLVGEFSLLRRPIDAIVARASLIAASSTFEDGRLVLILSLPALVRQRRGRTRSRPVEAAPSTRKTVLVIDDSVIVRDLLTQVLGHAGLQVRVAADGRSGLAAIVNDRPDVVVLDVDMPAMDGFAVLAELGSAPGRPPVIMLTTRASAEDQRKAAALGASAYVVKGQFDEATLLDAVFRLTTARRLSA